MTPRGRIPRPSPHNVFACSQRPSKSLYRLLFRQVYLSVFGRYPLLILQPIYAASSPAVFLPVSTVALLSVELDRLSRTSTTLVNQTLPQVCRHHLSRRRCNISLGVQVFSPTFRRQIIAHPVYRLRVSRICSVDLAFPTTVTEVERQFQLGCLELGLFFRACQSPVSWSPWHAEQFKG